jgi:hypothetical protein
MNCSIRSLGNIVAVWSQMQPRCNSRTGRLIHVHYFVQNFPFFYRVKIQRHRFCHILIDRESIVQLNMTQFKRA